MLKETHYFNGKKINPPQNQDEIGISISNNIDSVSNELSTKTFTWLDGEAAEIRAHLESGKLYKKLNHEIRFTGGGVSKKFEKFVDISGAEFDKDRVDADSITDKSPEWLDSVAAGISMERLFLEGVLKSSDDIPVPYCLSTIPDYRAAFLALLGGVTVSIALEDAVNELLSIAAEMVTIFDSVGAFIRVLVRLLYIGVLILTIVELILDLFAFLVQRVKYTPGMSVNTQIRAALGTIGMQFDSPFDDELTILPKQFNAPENLDDSRIRGVFFPNDSPLNGFYRGTLKELITAVREVFYLKLEINGRKVSLKPYNQKPTAASVVLPKLDQHRSRINARDLVPNLALSFSHDLRDDNTITNWVGTNVVVSFRPGDGAEAEHNPFSKTGVSKVFPFALATTKKELSGVEKVLDALAPIIDAVMGFLIKAINKITDAINTVVDFIEDVLNKILGLIGQDDIEISTNIPDIPDLSVADLLEDRVGMLALANDTFNVDKLCYIKTSENSRRIKVSKAITAKGLYLSNWQGINAQTYKFPLKNVELTLPEALTIVDELAARYKNSKARLIALDWVGNLTGGLAEIEVEVFKNYVNLLETIMEPDARERIRLE